MTHTRRLVLLVVLAVVLSASVSVGTVGGQMSGADDIRNKTAVEQADTAPTSDSTVGQDGEATDLTGQDEVTVEVGAGPQGFKFDPADIVVDEGTTVRWVWTGEGGQHNIVESDGEDPLDNPSFESQLVGDGDHEFTHTFGELGTHDYVCSVHINQGMVGSVEVLEDDGDEDDLVEDINKVFPDTGGASGIQTSDGGFALATSTGGGPGDFHPLLLKTDENGNEEFRSSVEGLGEGVSRSVVETSDGGFLLAGGVGNPKDAALIKMDPNGNEEFIETFGGSDSDDAFSAIETSDGGFALTGKTRSFASDPSDAWVIKTDENGNEEFRRVFSNLRTAYSITETSDGGLAIAGLTDSIGSSLPDAFLLKTDSNGNEEFRTTFDGQQRDDARSVIETSDGGFALAGTTRSFAGDATAWLIKTDENGNEEFRRIFSGTTFGRSVTEMSDGGFAFAADNLLGSDSEPLLIRTDANGNEKFRRTFERGNNYLPLSVVGTSDGGVAMIGQKPMPIGSAWLLKLSQRERATVKTDDITIEQQGATGESALTIDANNGMSIAQVEMEIDTAVGEVSSVQEGADVDSGDPGVTFDVVNETNDSVRIEYNNIGASEQDIEDFELAVVEFEAQTDDGTASINLNAESVVDGNQDEYTEITEEPGTLTVGELFAEPLPGFNNPPTNTGDLDPNLYEDINGDGDGVDPSQTVDLWAELVLNPQDFDDLTQQQVDALDWNGDGQLTPSDAVSLWTEQVLA